MRGVMLTLLPNVVTVQESCCCLSFGQISALHIFLIFLAKLLDFFFYVPPSLAITLRHWKIWVCANMASAGQSADAVATTFKRLHPQAYLGRFLSSAIREDGRSLLAFRETTVALGSITTADGSAFVRMGNTSCIAAVKAEIAVPQLSRPQDGYLIPNVELAAVCSSKFKPGAPGNEAQVLTDRVLTFLNNADLFVTNDTLCIHSGKAVWCLYLDVSFICFDGNAFDAAILAAVGALLITTLPKAMYDEDTDQVTCSSKDSRMPLKLANLPLSASFTIFENAYLLSDASAFEAALSQSHCSIGFQAPLQASHSSNAAQMSYLHQSASFRTVVPESGKVTTDQTNLAACMTAAQTRCNQLRQLLLDTQTQS